MQRRLSPLATVPVAAMLAAGCASTLRSASTTDRVRAPTTTAAATATAPTTTAATKTAPTTTTRPASTSAITPTTGVPVGTITTIPPATRAAMTGRSWHAGCPVSLDQLRLLTLSYWGFDGRAATGHLIVNARQANAMVAAFRRLFQLRFRIERMVPVDAFDADDDAAMAANDTSGFNCRRVVRTRTWSQHAYGLAVDVNPRVNPWLHAGRVDPPNGAPYVDRTLGLPGMITAGDAVVRAFAAVGWRWGGYQRSARDYQHFSPTGR